MNFIWVKEFDGFVHVLTRYEKIEKFPVSVCDLLEKSLEKIFPNNVIGNCLDRFMPDRSERVFLIIEIQEEICPSAINWEEKTFRNKAIYESFILVKDFCFSPDTSPLDDNDINFVNYFPVSEFDFKPVLEKIVIANKGQRKNSVRVMTETLIKDSALAILSHFDGGDFTKTDDFSVEQLKEFPSFPRVLAILGCDSKSLAEKDRQYLHSRGVETLILSCKKLSAPEISILLESYSNDKSISFLSSVIAFGPYMVFGNPFCFEKNYLNERLINSFCISPGSDLFLPPETTKGQFEKYKKSYTNKNNVLWKISRREYSEPLFHLSEKYDHDFMNLLYFDSLKKDTEKNEVSKAYFAYRSGDIDTFLKILESIREQNLENSLKFFGLLPRFLNICISFELKNIAAGIIDYLDENKPSSLSLDDHEYLKWIILDLEARFSFVSQKEHEAFQKMEEKRMFSNDDTLREKAWQLVFVAGAIDKGIADNNKQMQTFLQNEIPEMYRKVSRIVENNIPTDPVFHYLVKHFSMYLYVSSDSTKNELALKIVNWIEKNFLDIRKLTDPTPFIFSSLLLNHICAIKVDVNRYIDLLIRQNHFYAARFFSHIYGVPNNEKLGRKIKRFRVKIIEIVNKWAMAKDFIKKADCKDSEFTPLAGKIYLKDLPLD